MPSRSRKEGEHMFSIELKSKECLKRVAIPDDAGDNVLIEGFLGEVETVDIIEDVMLEIKGTNGILRMDLRDEELRSCFKEVCACTRRSNE